MTIEFIKLFLRISKPISIIQMDWIQSSINSQNEFKKYSSVLRYEFNIYIVCNNNINMIKIINVN